MSQGDNMTSKKRLFENLTRLATGLVEIFGPNCEAVVHDFAKLPNSLIFMSGNVTGRSLGAPLTDFVLRELKRKGDEIEDAHAYRTITQEGRILKSSTIFIRDDKGHVVGAMCVNFDMTDFLSASALLGNFTSFQKNNGEGAEFFARSLNESIEAFMNEAITRAGKHPSAMNLKERLDLLRHLDSQGAFLLKGAVEEVSAMLGVSRYTIYNYLKKTR
jgi:predicted transcriptional regulator YheO